MPQPRRSSSGQRAAAAATGGRSKGKSKASAKRGAGATRKASAKGAGKRSPAKPAAKRGPAKSTAAKRGPAKSTAAKRSPAKSRRSGGAKTGLTVAVTGPTGDIGKALVRALEASRSVKRIIGMARRPFDPTAQGWKKTEYRRGDVLGRTSVDALVADADVVVHLAFIIMGGRDETRRINLTGSRNVFEASIDAGVGRLIYASSVAAYGFHDNNLPLYTEDVPPRGTDSFYYSAQKAELEGLLEGLLEGSKTEAYVFRPCIVAGPTALLLIENIPYISIGDRLPGAVRALFDVVPVLKPVVPDPGVPFQLVHEDDVAAAMRAAIEGKGEPGVFNLAGPGLLSMSDLAEALDWYAVPVPELTVDAVGELAARVPFLPPEAAWIQAFRSPVIMDTTKAERELGWKPQHDGRETLRQTVAGAREGKLLR